MCSRLAVALVMMVTAVGGAGCGDDDDGSCLPECTGTRAYDAQAYALRARFDWTAGRLVATEDITLALPADAPPVVELDAEVEVGAVTAAGAALPFAVDADAGTLRVDLARLTDLVPGAASVTFTVAYTAAVSDALIAGGPRDDDPVRSRMLYTDSEPDRGVRWLVAKHDPADRATFAATLTVAADEDMVGNGERIGDRVVGDGREVAYALAEPIPTYLMAFAAGQLEHTDRTTGRVPLAVWYRRGLVLDPAATLDVVGAAMARFEELLGPYPWSRYAVVLVPQYGGGMENATITFNNELTSQGVVSVGLNAHELGHQWFGDWVTMRTYDDVWIKEGMATLLAAEATRAERDGEGRGRRFGTDFSFWSGDAIVDPLLRGLDKYTSGPYTRAAWLLTQLRARVGEEVFWATLRDVLADHALGSVDGDGFVRAFAPALDDATIEHILDGLTGFAVPELDVVVTPGAGATDVTFTVTDPGGTLLVPIGLTVVDRDGAATATTLDASAPRTVTVPAGGYLALDEADVHPYWTSSFVVDRDVYDGELMPLTVPGALAALGQFSTRSAAHQERALYEAGLPPLPPLMLDELVGTLDSPFAARQATVLGCAALAAAAAGPDADGWTDSLTALLSTPAVGGFSTPWGRCPPALVQRVLGAELAATAPLTTPAALARLEYLLAFDHGADPIFAAAAAVATSGVSLRIRDQALSRLGQQGSALYPSPVPAASVAAWQALFRGRLATVTSATRFRYVWRGVAALADAAALVEVAPLLHRVRLAAQTQRDTVCGAYAIATAVDAAAWPAFQAAAQPWTTLAAEAQAVLADPSTCP